MFKYYSYYIVTKFTKIIKHSNIIKVNRICWKFTMFSKMGEDINRYLNLVIQKDRQLYLQNSLCLIL